jgi:hypothetical protein
VNTQRTPHNGPPTELPSRRENRRATLYRPSEVAKMLDCSEWWVKEQARKRRIPYSWIGGSYRFTDDHVRAIVRLFEVQPVAPGTGSTATVRRRPPSRVELETRLRARTPPRALRARRESSNAA